MAVTMLRVWLFAVTALAAWDDGTLQYPIEGLCRRWDMQTAVLDNKLYLIGGRVTLQDHLLNTSTVGFVGEPSKEFIELDLTKTIDISTTVDAPGSQVVWKPVEVKGERPDLALSGGGMFTSRNGKLYLYDGQKMGESKADDKSSLVSFDTRSQMFKTEATWAQDDGYTPFRYSRGAAVDIPELGLGIYVGGARLWEGAEASKKWYYPADHQMMTMSIGEQNWDRKWSRLAKDRKTIGASVTWLPVGGDKGILVVIGGTYERSERTSGPGEDGDKIPSYSMMAPIAEVWIYDLNADKWYFQETTGAIPAERMSACAVGVTAPDKKSHQIFYYGGSSPTPMFGLNVDEVNKKNTFGDLYVLSLPTFKWLKLEKLDDVPLSRSRHNCHVINNRQMLIVGGGRDQSKDLQEYFRTTCRWDEISVLDMSALRWETQYTPAKTPYTVSTEVAQDSMDSSGQPGTAPSVGWATSELKELFSPSANVSGPTPDTTAPQPPKSSKATIIGAAVGGSVGVLLVAAAIIAFLWKRKRDKKIASMVEPTAGSVQQTETAAPISRQSPPPGYWDPRTRSFISTTGTWYLHAASGSPVSPQFADIHEVIGDDIGPEPVEAVEADSKPVLHELPSP